MATFQISIAASRPVLSHHSGPNLRRSLVFFVHHRSGSQQRHIPPSSPDRSWAQSLTQLFQSTRNSNWDRIARSYPWGKGKLDRHQWLQNPKDWFHVTSGGKYGIFHKTRHNARCAAREVDSIHRSVFRALDIMSKPSARQGSWPAQSTTVQASARVRASLFEVVTHASVKPHMSAATADISRDPTFEKQQEFEVSALSKPQSPVSLGKPQETTLSGATGNTEVASQVASSDIDPIDIHSQSKNEISGTPPGAVTNKDSDLQATAADVESVEPNDSGKASKLSPADLVASLRYYDRRRGTLPDEEPLSPEDVAVLESSRAKLTKGESRSETSSDHPTKKSSFKRIGLAVSSVVVGAYIFGVGSKLLSVQPESTTAVELFPAVQHSKVTKDRVD